MVATRRSDKKGVYKAGTRLEVLTAEGIQLGCLVKKLALGSVLDQSSKNKRTNRNKEAPDHWLVKLDGQDDDIPFSEHSFGKLVDVFPDAMETSESDTSSEELFAPPLPTTTKDDATTTVSTAASTGKGDNKRSTTTRSVQQKHHNDTDVVMSPEPSEAPEKNVQSTRQTRHSRSKTAPITPEPPSQEDQQQPPSKEQHLSSSSMIQTRSGRRTPPRSATPPLTTRRPPRKAAKTVAKQPRVYTRRSGPISRVVSSLVDESKNDVQSSAHSTLNTTTARPTKAAQKAVSKATARKNSPATASKKVTTKSNNNVETIVYSTGILYIYKGKRRRGAKFVPTK